MSTIVVSAAEAGATVLEVLGKRLGLSPFQALGLLAKRKVQLGGMPCVEPGRRVRRGQRLEIRQPPNQPASSEPVVRYADAHLVVVDKPAGWTTMRHREEAAEFGKRAQRFLPPTLADLLPMLLAKGQRKRPGRLRAVHRLDKDTSGLVVFAGTREAEQHLGKQFRAHTIQRRYLAVVRGRAKDERIESNLIPDRGDGRRGSSPQPGEGKGAITHVKVLEDLGDYTLVECRLETGRTHQVRIHLGEKGTPLCGERIYDRPVHGKPLPDKSGATRLALHAANLGFEHPATGKWMEWRSPLPSALTDLIVRLRKRHQKPKP
jgi:23S rRNA pseudouridine1911/1915/1917 synthase